MQEEDNKVLETLSPIEQKILPHLKSSISEIEQKSSLDKVSVLRALQFLARKGVLELQTTSKEIVDLSTNGLLYKKNHLPERRLLDILSTDPHISFEDAKKQAKLSDNELKVSIGILKRKALASLSNGKIILTAKKEEITKKMLEEQLLEILPKETSSLPPEHQFALNELKKRKDIIEIKKETETTFKLTSLGEKLAGSEVKLNLVEELTPDLIKNWTKGKQFRRYDLTAPVPKRYPGKRHFVNESIEYTRRIWLDMGFKEAVGNMAVTSFWNFDALFSQQDHPTRDMQDTFFINKEGKLPSAKIVSKVKEAHEKGVDSSLGWRYSWKEEEAKKVVLRTHTTALTAQVLASLTPKDLPAKYFAIGKVFRNETVDWSHGFEFYQTEGIVVDENVTFRHLLGYLTEFYKKMGFEKVRFIPAYFPFTEPSVEVAVFHPVRKVWLELGGAGVFRPELTIPLLGKPIPVLAWGQGFDRIITDYYKINDLKELYSNDLKMLREMRSWIK